MIKFNRQYLLTITFTNGSPPLIVQLPITMEFDITRSCLGSLNVCQIRLRNLSQNVRNQLLFNITDSKLFYGVTLQAGYGPTNTSYSANLPIVFSGNITQAWSVREGTDFITTLECFDGGYAVNNGVTSLPVPSSSANPTTKQSVIETLAASLPTPTGAPFPVGVIGSFPGTLPKGVAYNGNTYDILQDLTNRSFFIDNGVANALSEGQCFNGALPIIDDSAGLLGTPVREHTIITFDMIFEPRLQIGQLIQFSSTTGPTNFNTQYITQSIKHRGTISGAVSGDATTSTTVYVPNIPIALFTP